MPTHKSSPYSTSKMVVDRQRAAGELAAVLERHAQEAQEALAMVIAPYLDEGEEAPDLFVLQKALRRRLVELDRDLVQADDETIRERLEDRGMRRQRTEVAAELAHRLSRLRAGVEAAYGPGSAAEILEMEGPVPRDPVVLHRLGVRVVERLREDPFSGHRSQLRGIVLDAGAWVEDLQEPVEHLGETLETLVLEGRDSISSLLRKKRAMREYDEAYLTLARAFENLFRHVGLRELSRTVRPRRRSRLHRPEEAAEALSTTKAEGGQASEERIEGGPIEPAPKQRISQAAGPRGEPWPELKILHGGRGGRASPSG